MKSQDDVNVLSVQGQALLEIAGSSRELPRVEISNAAEAPSDGLGENLPPDYLIRVQGGCYGWPCAYIDKHLQPGFASLAPDKVEVTIRTAYCERAFECCSAQLSKRRLYA